jgi:hypothetical protein
VIHTSKKNQITDEHKGCTELYKFKSEAGQNVSSINGKIND